MIRVLLVDDHPSLRLAMHLVLDREKDIQVVGEAQDGVEAVEAVEDLAPDVVVMDLNMPRMGGIDAAKKISKTAPKTRIIGFSMLGNTLVDSTVKIAGVCDFVAKASGIDALMKAIRRAANNGRAQVSPAM